jgi:hypothetical protein
MIRRWSQAKMHVSEKSNMKTGLANNWQKHNDRLPFISKINKYNMTEGKIYSYFIIIKKFGGDYNSFF